MHKNFNKICILALISSMILLSFGCKKKARHKWIEVRDGQPVVDIQNVTPGVHPERGSESDAVKIVLAPIYYPIGRDKDGKPQYKKYLYELEELTPENIDLAMKDISLITEDSLFCDLVVEESDEVVNAGPGATSATLTKKGTVRYVDLASDADNSDNYEGKTYIKDLAGMIDQNDIEHCITETFRENFQLVSCDIEPVDYEVYKKIHNK